MANFKKVLSLFLIIAVFVLLMPVVSYADQQDQAKNACNLYAKNACNPCAKNACNPCNPCGKKMKNACNPCNPCGDKPPKPIRAKHISNYSRLVAMGKKLWNDESIGNSGQSCMGCHDDYENFNSDTVGPFPHYVGMPKDIVTLDQMINFCMINPMDGKMLGHNSIEMTAMSAFYQEFIKSYKKPKNACNPCGKRMKNPCNPCGRR